jgi:outer membrane murein-binding lipoprotein Lpp
MDGGKVFWENLMSQPLMKIAPVLVVLVGSLGLAGCATKGFVREQVATVNQRVDALDARLQATDSTAKQALAEAQAASGQAQNNGQRLDQLNARVDGVEQRMQDNRRKRARN